MSLVPSLLTQTLAKKALNCYNIDMDWFNYYGLAIIVIIMIPNIIFAIKCKDGFENLYKNKVVEVLEQIGRYGCFALMIFNIPYTYFNFWFENALWVYIGVNGALCVAYIAIWIVYGKSNGILKALSLSILPSLIFLFSGILLANIPLLTFAVIFSINHILLSYKNVQLKDAPQS